MIFSMNESIINGRRASAPSAALVDGWGSVPSAALVGLGAGAAVHGHRAGAHRQLRQRLPETADRGRRRRALPAECPQHLARRTAVASIPGAPLGPAARQTA